MIYSHGSASIRNQHARFTINASLIHEIQLLYTGILITPSETNGNKRITLMEAICLHLVVMMLFCNTLPFKGGADRLHMGPMDPIVMCRFFICTPYDNVLVENLYLGTQSALISPPRRLSGLTRHSVSAAAWSVKGLYPPSSPIPVLPSSPLVNKRPVGSHVKR